MADVDQKEQDESSTFVEEVGRRLRAIRRQQGLSLEDVEERSGGRWSASAVGAYERGYRVLSLARLRELAEFYGVPMSVVVGEVDLREQPIPVAGPPKVILDLVPSRSTRRRRRSRVTPNRSRSSEATSTAGSCRCGATTCACSARCSASPSPSSSSVLPAGACSPPSRETRRRSTSTDAALASRGPVSEPEASEPEERASRSAGRPPEAATR